MDSQPAMSRRQFVEQSAKATLGGAAGLTLWGTSRSWAGANDRVRVMFDDDQQTPNIQMAVFEFPNPQGGGDKKKILQFEVRHWMTNYEGDFGKPPENNIGNIFYGSEGYMTMHGRRWQTFLGKKREPGPSGQETGNTDREHYQNFIDAIRANDPSLLHGNVEEGHYSCTLIHLANASYRLGRSLDFDPQRQRCIKDAEANRMLSRDYRAPFVIPREV